MRADTCARRSPAPSRCLPAPDADSAPVSSKYQGDGMMEQPDDGARERDAVASGATSAVDVCRAAHRAD